MFFCPFGMRSVSLCASPLLVHTTPNCEIGFWSKYSSVNFFAALRITANRFGFKSENHWPSITLAELTATLRILSPPYLLAYSSASYRGQGRGVGRGLSALAVQVAPAGIVSVGCRRDFNALGGTDLQSRPLIQLPLELCLLLCRELILQVRIVQRLPCPLIFLLPCILFLFLCRV